MENALNVLYGIDNCFDWRAVLSCEGPDFPVECTAASRGTWQLQMLRVLQKTFCRQWHAYLQEML